MADNFDTFRPDWTVGTLTLTGGSADFTATDANLILASIREGDAILTPSGLFLPIETLAQDGLSGTLAAPAPASAGGTFQTRIRFQSDNSRYTGMLAALVARMSSGNLQSLAGLQGLQDLLPIFLGPGSLGLINKSELGLQDPNESLGKLAAIELGNRQILQTDGAGALTALTLAAQQILQTDANGALKAIALAANKALVTDANKDVQQIDLGAIGRTLLALSAGTNAQYIQGDGTVQAKTGLPISTATQTALNAKANNSGAAFTTGISINSGNPGTGQTMINFGWSGRQPSYKMFLGSGEQFIMDLYDGITGNYVRGAFQVDRSGNTAFYGSISKAGGTFLIDHPLDPENKDLAHAFVEAPENLNVYRGEARLSNGRATVNIDEFFLMSPGTFTALNADLTVSSLQNQDSFSRLRPSSDLVNGSFEIICEDENSTDLVSWTVTGRRKDAYVLHSDPNCERGTGRFIAEREKEDV